MNPILNHVSERGSQAVDRIMQDQFGFSLSLDEMAELRDAIYRICNNAVEDEQKGE